MKNQKENSFAVIDFEASKWINYLCNGLYDGDTYEEFTNLDECFDFLHDYHCTTIFAHFGGIYDFLFIIGHVLDGESYTLEGLIPRGSGILCFTIRSNVNGRRFRFYDSSALLPFSLRNIAINFNVDTLKGEIDYEKITKVTPELLKYMKDDHLALHQCLTKFFEWDLIALHGYKKTLASQALHIFKKEFYYKRTLESLPKRLDEFCRNSYLGGRTEIFNMIYDNPKKDLFCYDVNSLYPTVMQKEDFPSTFQYYTDDYEPESMGIYHLRVIAPDNIHIPILGAKMKVGATESFVFPTGEFDGHWTSSEIKYALINGYKIIKCYRGAIFNNDGKIFKRFIDYFYNKRLKSKSEVDKTICKLLMNSLYGRFGMNTEKEQLHLEKGESGEAYHSTIRTTSGKEFNFFTSTENIHTFSNVAIASFVTAYARIHMHKAMKKLKYRVWYMDTDSIFTDQKIKTGIKLGELKLEYAVNRACFMLPKTYLVESPDMIKVTMKGFPKKKVQHFKYSDFLTCLEGDLKILNKEQKNPLTVTIDSKVNKFRSGLKVGNMLSMSKPMIKKVSSKYNKRIVNKDFTTSPIKV